MTTSCGVRLKNLFPIRMVGSRLEMRLPLVLRPKKRSTVGAVHGEKAWFDIGFPRIEFLESRRSPADRVEPMTPQSGAWLCCQPLTSGRSDRGALGGCTRGLWTKSWLSRLSWLTNRRWMWYLRRRCAPVFLASQDTSKKRQTTLSEDDAPSAF